MLHTYPKISYSAVCFALMSLLMLIQVPKAEAQFDNSGEFIRAGIDDANTLFSSYLEPFGKGFGAGLNSGWVQSAKPHGKLGFNLSFRMSGALVPNVDNSFDVTGLPLQRLEYANDANDSPITPTFTGVRQTGSRMIARHEISDSETVTLADFNMPQGIGIGVIPSPMIQAGVGIIRDTEITLRYMPPVSMPFDGQANLWGGSIKHGLNQWIPGGALLPVDFSVMAGYTSLSMNVNLDVQPQEDQYTRNPYEDAPETWSDQSLAFTSNGFTTMLLAGKNLPVLAIYGGVGYERSTTTVATLGSFPVKVEDDQNDPERPMVIQKEDDPIDLEFSGTNSLRAMLGMRVRLGLFSINADYTHARYPIASVGLGISFR